MYYVYVFLFLYRLKSYFVAFWLFSSGQEVIHFLIVCLLNYILTDEVF